MNKKAKKDSKKNNVPEKIQGEWLTPEQAGRLLDVHAITLRRYRAQGKLKSYRLGGTGIRYKRGDLMSLLQPILEGEANRFQERAAAARAVMAKIRRRNLLNRTGKKS